ncbi:MAG: hypothetical protein AAGF04_00860 [Chlamydiota bacterium]
MVERMRFFVHICLSSFLVSCGSSNSESEGLPKEEAEEMQEHEAGRCYHAGYSMAEGEVKSSAPALSSEPLVLTDSSKEKSVAP